MLSWPEAPLAFTLTCTTPAPRMVAAGPPVRVCLIEWTTVDTSILGVVPGRHRIAAQGVRAAGHCLQMTHACPDSTEMVDDQALRDWAPMLKFPCSAMGTVFSTERAEAAIASTGVQRSTPQPVVARAIDPRPEAL